MILYHGTNSDFDSFSYDFVGKGNDQYGPGFYMVSDPKLATSYGKVTAWEADVSKVKDKSWLYRKADYRMFTSLIKEAPDLEDTLQNFGYPAMTTGMNNAIKWIVMDNNNFDALQSIWWDFYRDAPALYLRKLVEKGVDGILINSKQDSRGLDMPGHFYVMYNPEKVKRVGDTGSIAESVDSNGYIHDRDLLKKTAEIYDELNTKLYNGKMPAIQFALTKSARVGASTESVVNRSTGRPVTRPTKMVVSNHWKWTESNLRSVVGHEIIHVWQSVEQKIFGARDGGHDWAFKAEMERINKLMPGLNVKLAHENAVTSSDVTVKSSTIVFAKDNGEFSIVACRPNDLQRIKTEVENVLRSSKAYTRTGGKIHVTQDAGGEAAKYPKSVKNLRFFKISAEEAGVFTNKALETIDI